MQWTAPGENSWADPLSQTSAIATSANTLVAASSQKLGIYRCRAVNAMGAASATVELRVQSIPDPPINQSLVASSAESLTVRWLRPFDGSRNVSLHYTVFYSTSSKASGTATISTCDWPLYSACSFTLQKLMPSTTYTLYVKASNFLGTSNASNALVVQTLGTVE